MNPADTPTDGAKPQTIPEHLPYDPPPRIAPRRFGMIVGMVGLWIAPRRIGPHLGACPWWRAVAVGIVGAVGSASMVNSAAMGWFYPEAAMTLSERVRLGPACAVLGAMRLYTDRQMLTEVAPIGLLIWGGGVLAIGLVAMPWADAGEERRHLFSRCLKTACWVVSLGIPAGLAAVVVEHVGPPEWRSSKLFYMAAGLAAIFWVVSVWRRALVEYAGPPEGSGWRPIGPQCGECGYILTGMSADESCPECGRAIAESIGGSREAVRWQRATWIVPRAAALFPTIWQAAFDRTFFQRLPVLSHRPAAGRFTTYNWTAFTLAAIPVAYCVTWIKSLKHGSPLSLGLEGCVEACLHAAWVFLAGQALIQLAHFWLTTRHRPRPSGAAPYLSALLWPWALGTTAVYLGVYLAPDGWQTIPLSFVPITGAMLFHVVLIVAAMAELALLGWVVRRSTRSRGNRRGGTLVV